MATAVLFFWKTQKTSTQTKIYTADFRNIFFIFNSLKNKYQVNLLEINYKFVLEYNDPVLTFKLRTRFLFKFINIISSNNVFKGLIQIQENFIDVKVKDLNNWLFFMDFL